MPITAEVFEPVFDSLLGDEVRVAAFKEVLTERIHGAPEQDSYDVLQTGVILQLDDAIYASGVNIQASKEIRQNEVFGVQLATGVLRGVDDTYTQRANEPQAITNVARNTNRALQYLRTMAYGGKVSHRNEAAYFHGSNPRNPISQAIAKFVFARNLSADSARMNTRTFAVTEDEAGQLDMPRRHKMIRPDGMDRCPAADVKVSMSDKPRPGLWVMMEAMGSVAITEIFSQHFQIIEHVAASPNEASLVAA
jgi:hypothetical protein